MQRWLLTLVLCGLFPGAALAQALTVQFGEPAIRWEARPAMVVVAPGVRVVEDSPYEVFYYRNYYWTQDNGHWFRARNHSGNWVVVDRRYVPGRFYANPPGHYRNYKNKAVYKGTSYKVIKRPGNTGNKGAKPTSMPKSPVDNSDPPS